MKSFSLQIARWLAIMAFLASQPGYAKTSNDNNGKPFDCSKNPKLCTGNNGNGNGNTGPGNQGNEGSNGNAGGGSTGGSSTGGSNNGGSSNGNANGNANGNSNGNANGNSNGGGTTGGSNVGGSTTGGSSIGGSSNGTCPNGPLHPCNGGGSSTGGSSTGGSSTGGSSTGGSSTGGSSTGGSSTGGSSTGGSSTGGDNNGPLQPPKPEEKENRNLKSEIEPLFYFDYDFGSGVIAVDSANSDDSLRSELKLTKTAPLYQKVSYELLEGGLGGKFQFYFKNASGLASHWWAQVGLMPMKGTEVSSVRYASNLSLAKSLKGYKKAPEDVTELYQWQIGDSITYQSKGGLIFVAGTGFGFPGLTATSLAQGTWEVHVEKVSKSKVYVKITKSKLHALSMSAGSGLAAVGLHQFKNADDGFSYLLDLQNEEARKVYMDLVRGNVTAAQNLSSPQSQSPSAIPAVQKVENFKRFSKGKGISFFFGLPIFLNVTKSENKIQSLSVTDFLIDQSKVKAQFGIYDLTVQTKALGIHTVISKAFYGVKYLISDLKTSVAKEKGEFGRFSWVYQDDRGSTRTLKNSLVALIDQTGFDQLNLAIPQTSAGLDFTNLSLNLKMNSDNTRLVSDRFARMSKSDLKDWATKRAEHAYSLKGDSLCTLSSESQTSCEQLLVSETVYAAKKMQETLEEMKKKAGNDASYTKAFAEFGKLAMTNQVTLGMMISLAGRGLEMNFAVEGTYFQPVKISYITNDSGGFERIKSAKDADTSLDPKYKRSKFHGVITNKNLSGLGSPL